jgi:hypothetical protein
MRVKIYAKPSLHPSSFRCSSLVRVSLIASCCCSVRAPAVLTTTSQLTTMSKGKWNCPACTFENNNRAKCEICDTPFTSISTYKAPVAPSVATPIASSQSQSQSREEKKGIADDDNQYYGLISRYRWGSRRPRPWRRPTRPWRNPDRFIDPFVPEPLPVITTPATGGLDEQFWPVPLESVTVNTIIHDFAAQVR